MRAWILAVALLAGCRRHPPPPPPDDAPDAAPREILTPSGPVSPEKVRREVEDTLEKEHERTLKPVVE